MGHLYEKNELWITQAMAYMDAKWTIYMGTAHIRCEMLV